MPLRVRTPPGTGAEGGREQRKGPRGLGFGRGARAASSEAAAAPGDPPTPATSAREEARGRYRARPPRDAPRPPAPSRSSGERPRAPPGTHTRQPRASLTEKRTRPGISGDVGAGTELPARGAGPPRLHQSEAGGWRPQAGRMRAGYVASAQRDRRPSSPRRCSLWGGPGRGGRRGPGAF